MRFTQVAPLAPVFRRTTTPARSRTTSATDASSPEAIAEISAYIAVRDQSLADAERVPTRGTVDRALRANEFVESCIRPARSPYQAQSLPATAAANERQRCAAARARLAQLSARLADTRCAAAA